MTTPMRIEGAWTALVTPFTEDTARIDFEAFDSLVHEQVLSGIAGLLPCGTTGETPTLSDDEQLEVIRHTVAIAGGHVPVIAGASSNSTRKTIHLAQRALQAGVDGVMVVMPYYNKPTQEGLFAHVLAVAREIRGAPLVVYNIPGRSVVDLSLETLMRIADAAPNVIAVKDATGNVLRCQSVVNRIGDRLAVMCGDDALTLPMMACGAKGVISVTSNVFPSRVAAVCRLAREGRWDQARAAHFALLDVHDVMFIETSPGPVKTALAHRGRMGGALRLPLVAPSATSRTRIIEVINKYEHSPHT